MTETPDLETILGIGLPMTSEKKYDVTAARLIAVREQIKALKAEEVALEDSIWTLTPDESGEFDVQGEQYAFTIQRSELWKWNSAKLEVLAARNPNIGAVVSSKFNLKQNEYLPLMGTLSAADAKELEEALTRKPGRPRVKVRRKV